MVKRLHDCVFVQDHVGVLDILFFDALDGSNAIGVTFHLGLVDGGKGPSTENLFLITTTSWIS